MKEEIQETYERYLDELRKIVVNDYGADRFWKLIDGE